MTFTEACWLLSHPIVFQRKALYATRVCWYKAAIEEANRIEDKDTTKPFTISIDPPYMIWPKALNQPLLYLKKEGENELVAIHLNDIPEECVKATDWYVVKNPPVIHRLANRDKMDIEWLKQSDLPQPLKELLP